LKVILLKLPWKLPLLGPSLKVSPFQHCPFLNAALLQGLHPWEMWIFLTPLHSYPILGPLIFPIYIEHTSYITYRHPN
jgi:hypothetical protein